MKLRRLAPWIALFAALPSQAAVTLLDKDSWKIDMGGFIEVDGTYDSTRSFNETIGNAPVLRPDDVTSRAVPTGNGVNSRTQMSVRNSRLSFNVQAPEVEGVKTKGFFEMDFLGFNPSPGTSNTESGLYNNPTMRVRHAYLAAEHDDFQLLAGQTWMLMGWQPFYFLNTVDIQPIPAMLYNRTVQVRATKRFSLSDDQSLWAALAVMRPPQRDSAYPGLEGGLRWTYDGRKSGFTGGGSGALVAQPLSLAVSGNVREYTAPGAVGSNANWSNFPGSAIAVNTLIPVLSSSDNKDVSGTLTLTGEFTAGTGDGDEFSSWTGGLASPLANTSSAAGSNGTALARNLNLDGGIGDYDRSQTFHLVHLLTYNLQLQYHLPTESHYWLDAGYSRIYSNNVGTLVSAAGKTSGGTIPYDTDEAVFANIFHQVTNQIRVGAEYLFVRTHYADGLEAHNNRYQLSAWFIF